MNTDKDNINIREKIDELFVFYEKRYSDIKQKTWWPVNISYGGKKYYPSTRLERLKNPNVTKILYYCNNHNLNTNNKKLKFNKQKCPGQLEYNRTNGKFYLIKKHNNLCDGLTTKEYDNAIEVETTILQYKQFKINMINFLNSHPLFTFKMFQKYVTEYLKLNPIDFTLKDNTLADIFYPWKRSSKIFSQFSIYDNNFTKDNQDYLRDVENILLYENNGKKMYWHSHIIWISPFFRRNIYYYKRILSTFSFIIL